MTDTQISFLANTLPEDATFEWSHHGILKITPSLGIHGLPASVGQAVADAYAKAMQEHLSASSHVSQASGGAGFSSHAAPPRNHCEEIEAARADCGREGI